MLEDFGLKMRIPVLVAGMCSTLALSQQPLTDEKVKTERLSCSLGTHSSLVTELALVQACLSPGPWPLLCVASLE